MEKAPLLLILLFACSIARAQTVENIQVEQEEDQILIHFRIGESTDMQIYLVELTCSMDGGPRFVPRSLRGEVGQNIRGGKSNYTIIWDVFEDYEEVGDVEFFIRVELKKDLSPISIPPEVINQPEGDPEFPGGGTEVKTVVQEPFDHAAMVSFYGSTYSPYGIWAGTVKDYGFYGSVRAGTNNDEVQTDFWFDIIAGFTKHLFTRGNYRLHAYAGLGSSIEFYEEYEFNTSWVEPVIAVDAGMINVVGRIAITAGLEYVNGYGVHIAYGVGFVF